MRKSIQFTILASILTIGGGAYAQVDDDLHILPDYDQVMRQLDHTNRTLYCRRGDTTCAPYQAKMYEYHQLMKEGRFDATMWPDLSSTLIYFVNYYKNLATGGRAPQYRSIQPYDAPQGY